MTHETPVSDELQRRIAELEKKAGRSGSLWDAVLTIIPAWLAVATIAGILGFKGWEYYQKAQQEAAKTQIAEIAAKMKGLEATTDNSALMKKLKAELEQRQTEAANARVEADAQRRQVDGVTIREDTVRAQIAGKRAEAEKAWALAEAANKKFGYSTLQQREARARLILTSANAAVTKVYRARSVDEMYRLACIDNPIAEMIGCPANYITRRLPPVGQVSPETSAARQDMPTADPSPAAARLQEQFATVATLGLNLRKCPEASKACPPLTAQPLPQGSRLKYLGDAGNGWAKLQTNLDNGETIEGFANTKYLRF